MMAYGLLTDGGVMASVLIGLAALIAADVALILRNIRVVVVDGTGRPRPRR